MRYAQRMLIGLVLILVGFALLVLGSPDRTGQVDVNPAFVYGFVFCVALGFIIGTMGLLGAEGDYPGLLSSFVLYFIVGALIAVILYVKREGQWTLAEADDPNFWFFWLRRMALWPLELVRLTGFLGYRLDA